MKYKNKILLLVSLTTLLISGCSSTDHNDVQNLIDSFAKKGNPIAKNVFDDGGVGTFEVPSDNDFIEAKPLINGCLDYLEHNVKEEARRKFVIGELVTLSQKGFIGVIEKASGRDSPSFHLLSMYRDRISTPFVWFGDPSPATIESTKSYVDEFKQPVREEDYLIDPYADDEENRFRVAEQCMMIETQLAMFNYNSLQLTVADGFMKHIIDQNMRSVNKKINDVRDALKEQW